MKDIRVDRAVHFISATSNSSSQSDKPTLWYVCSADETSSKGNDRPRDRRILYEIDLKRMSSARTRRISSSHCVYVTEFRALSGHYCTDSSGRYVVACKDDRIQIWDAVSEEMFQYDHNYAVTAVVFHPQDVCLATGDQKGVVTLWYRLCQSNGCHPAKVLLHWHAHAVGGICFNYDGSYLYSGGEEAVLVVWQVETRKTRFVPRLGSAIWHVSCSQNSRYIALYHVDNIIQLVSGYQLEVERMVGGLIKTTGLEGSQYVSTIPTGLTVEPLNNLLVTNSCPGQLQFYSLWTDQHIGTIDVTGQNYVSRRESEPFVYMHVTHVAFSDCKCWMATVEHRDDKEVAMELTLKFWWFSEETQTYDVNTSVELPHQKQVTQLLFRPQKDSTSTAMCVSMSTDGKLKFWSLVTEESLEGKMLEWWNCQAVTCYHDLPAFDASFSEDGSLLAVTFGRTVTIWNSGTCMLQNTLSCPIKEEQIMKVLFGRDVASHCLVTASQHHLMTWNMLTCAVLWSVSMSIDVIISCPFSRFCAAFTSSGLNQMIVVFDPKSVKPVAVYDHVGENKIEAATFVPQAPYIAKQLTGLLTERDEWRLQSELLWMDNKQMMYSLQWPEGIEAGQLDDFDTTISSEETMTAFSAIFSVRKQINNTTTAPVGVRMDVATQTADLRMKMLSGPAHTLPSVSSISLKFLQSFLPKSSQLDEEDVAMEGAESKEIKPESNISPTDSEDDAIVDKIESHEVADSSNAANQIVSPGVSSLHSSQVGDFSWLANFFLAGDVE